MVDGKEGTADAPGETPAVGGDGWLRAPGSPGAAGLTQDVPIRVGSSPDFTLRGEQQPTLLFRKKRPLPSGLDPGDPSSMLLIHPAPWTPIHLSLPTVAQAPYLTLVTANVKTAIQSYTKTCVSFFPDLAQA